MKRVRKIENGSGLEEDESDVDGTEKKRCESLYL